MTCRAKSNSCTQDNALDIEMDYINHEGVIKTIFIEDNIASVVEVGRSVIVEATDKCSPSSSFKEAKIFHLNMSPLHVDTKTIFAEGEMVGEKEKASQLRREMEMAKEPNWVKERLKGEKAKEVVIPKDMGWVGEKAEEVKKVKEDVKEVE